MKLNDIFQTRDESNALGAMKDYVDKYNSYSPNRQLFSEVTPEAKAIGEKSKRDAEAYGRIHKMAPHLTPGVVLSLVNSGASDQVVAKVGLAALALMAENSKKEDEDRNIFLDIWAGQKTGLRWASAALNTGLDYANAAASMVVGPSDETGTGNVVDIRDRAQNIFSTDFFQTTELGSAIMNPTETGEGIFSIGGKAKEYRTKRQMELYGSIPLTIEAGATENSAFEADPDEINTIAMQILATKDITYEEAYDEANRLIRSNARLPITTFALAPLVMPKNLFPNFGNQTGEPTSGTQFQFGDIGTSEYAMASAVATLAAAVALPDPSEVLVWQKVAKPLIAYAKGIKYVDEAGNFTMDSRNIAQNGAEAKFMGDIDALNVLAKDYEVAGISSADEAVEMLTPQPGTWWHGSKTGPIEGDIVPIDDPRYPTPEGNLVGPAFYTTEANLMGGTYVALNADGTRALIPEEQAILDGLMPRVNPDALATPNARLGIPEEDLPAGAAPGTMYRFVESEGATPRFLDADYGLGEILPGATAPQATVEEINNIVDFFINADQINARLAALVENDQGLASFFESIGLPDFVKSLQDDAFDMVSNKGFLNTIWNRGYVDLNINDLNTRWASALEANPRLVDLSLIHI